MGKLMKYEWKKQKNSRLVVLVALIVCLLSFAGGMLFKKDSLMAVSVVVMLIGAFFVIFYMGIESILILNRDLKTKQSYMIWMVPKSVWEIFGAKFIAAIAQMFFVFVLYAVAGLLCLVGTAQYAGELGSLFQLIRDCVLEFSGNGQVIAYVLWTMFGIFIGWTEVIMVGYLSVILSRTVLRNSKYAGLLSVITFFVITFVVEKIYGVIGAVLPKMQVAGNTYFGVTYLIYYLIMCVIMFLLSGWMADRKLSV